LNNEMRRILDGFVGYLNRTSAVEENIKANMRGVMPFINRRSAFTGNTNSGFTGSTTRAGIAVYDFDVLKNDPDYKASFANVQGKTINFQAMLITMIEQSQLMTDILKQYQAGDQLAEVEFQ
ncbi:MAG: hypothetical protein HOM63_11635, partial [Kordiimonadaceae bacterium]|nr:hypothetical protein [Kordiimonadaceae bacterium]